MSEGLENRKPSEASDTRAGWTKFLSTFGRPLALVIVFCFFAILVPDWKFTKGSNLENLLVQSAVVAACSLGATMVIITAGIDLSAGSVIAFHKHSSDLASGDRALLCSFGGGYSVGSVVLRRL